MIANLFIGEDGGPRLFMADQGSHDAGEPVHFRLETVPAGPGLGNEAIFTELYLGATGDVSALVDVTPIISGTNDDGTPFETELETQSWEIALTADRMTAVKPFGLSLPLIVDDIERARFAPRGSWFRARITGIVHSGQDLIFEGQGVEMEVVRVSTPTPSPTPASS